MSSFKHSAFWRRFPETSLCSLYAYFCCYCCLSFFTPGIFAPLISCSGELGFVCSLTADQANLIISCLCHGVMLIPLLHNSSHHSVAVWLMCLSTRLDWKHFRTKNISQPFPVAQFLVKQRVFVKQDSSFLYFKSWAMIIISSLKDWEEVHL